jgi:hypothetical protein
MARACRVPDHDGRRLYPPPAAVPVPDRAPHAGRRPRDLLPAPAHVSALSHRNQHHAAALAELAAVSRRDTDPTATEAVARSINSHLPHRGIPLWFGVKNVTSADAAGALAAL